MKLLSLVSLALAIAVASAVPAFAGKPTKPYLTVSPASPTVTVSGPAAPTSSTFTLSGCGYTKLTTIIVWHNYAGPYQEVTPDEKGCVSATFTPFGLDPTGTYIAQAWQQKGQSWGSDPSVEITFTVS
jgi:hypothetical protein